MHKIRLKYVLALLAVACASCAVTNKFEVAEYRSDTKEKYPVLSVYSLRPPAEFRGECEDFAGVSALKYCHLNQIPLDAFQRELESSGLFNGILVADNDAHYRLAIATAIYITDDVSRLGNAVVAGATLGIVPLVTHATIKVNAELYWFDEKLGTFRYEIPFERRDRMVDKSQQHNRDVARSVVSRIIRDAQNADAFSPEFLARKIGSTVYSLELGSPENLPGYNKVGMLVFNHPFLGAQVRYESQSKPVHYLDEFVYPIRATDWNDVAEVLQKEAVNTRKDFELAAVEEEFKILHFSEAVIQSWKLSQGVQPVIYFDCTYTDAVGNKYLSRTYITTKNDKFIRIQHAALSGEIDSRRASAVAKHLLQESDVPRESNFMAKVRQQWRRNQLL